MIPTKYLLPLLIVSFTCLTLQPSYAQGLEGQALADSLKNELTKTKSDTAQIKLMSQLARVVTPLNPSQALDYANNAMNLAKKANWIKGMGLAHMNKATIYVTTSDYVAGLENAKEAYKIFDSLNWKHGMANALVEMSNSYENLGNYSKAIEYNFNALSIYEEAGMDEDVAKVSINIGNDYYWLFDYDKAIENYKRAFEINKKNNNKLGTAFALDNIANVYLDKGEYRRANEYNLQAIKLFEEINDPSELAVTYSIRGGILQKQKDFVSALEYYNKSMAINQRLDLKGNLINNYGGIGEMYLSLAKNELVEAIPASFEISKTALIQKARLYFTEAIRLSKETNRLSLMMVHTALLSETEALSGNYKAALAWYKESMNYKDSIFNDANKKKITALENQRLAEVKNKEIQLLNKDKALQASEIKRQVLIKDIILATVAVAILFASLFIWSFNRRKKAAFDKQVLETEMKALRAQMNPHFIFNSLNSINNYIMENDKGKASKYLAKFAELMRLILENSREQEVPLENDLAALELYMQLESIRFQNRFRYSIEIDPGIDKENTLIPPMLLQPFAENAILHGMKDKDGGLIKINIQPEDNNMIKCIVEDNGAGRKAAPVVEYKTYKKRKSLGIKILQERLSIINELHKTKAAIQVYDLKDAENKPEGLRIELLLPLQLAY